MPVLLPVALDQTYDYLLPADLEVAPGCFVLVPFGRRRRIGVVWDAPVGEGGKPVARKKLKSITAGASTCPRCRSCSLRFAEWVARYTLTPLGMVVRMMMGSPRGVRARASRASACGSSQGAAEPPRLTPARKRALDIAADGLMRAKSCAGGGGRLHDGRR